MFLNNSYFNVLRKVDKSWEERRHEKTKTSFWKRRFSRSASSQSSKSYSSLSSDESGLYSADINSGYYGDDEVDPCPKCLAITPVSGIKADIEDYDVISIEVNVRERKRNSMKTHRTLDLVNNCYDDEFVVIPSSREEFCSGNFKHSTPIKDASEPKDNLVTCIPKVVTPATQADGGCSCVTPQKPIRFRLYAPKRLSSDTGVWWRENISWQLKQRNKTQTTNFAQLQEHTNSHVKPRVRINRELADYLNKYAEFRPHNDELNKAFYDANAIDNAEILQAIRCHSGIDKTTRLRANSVAHRAKAYIESQKQSKDVKDTDDEDITIPYRKRSRSKLTQYRADRPMMPRWRESISSQLEMRNFLECKYFTDAIVRRKLSQLSISFSQTVSKSEEILTGYDVITDDDVSTVVTTRSSTNNSESVSQGYHSSPPGPCSKDPSAFIIRDLDAIYGQNQNIVPS